MQVEGGEACKLLRVGHALAKAEKLARHLQAIGGCGLQGEIDLAGRRVAQALDAALAVERYGAGRGKVEALEVESILGKAEFRVESSGGNVGQQKLADAERSMHFVVTQRAEQGLIRSGRNTRQPCIEVWQPASPRHAFAHHLAQIEAFAVEDELDDALLAAAIMQRAAEFRTAQLAACLLKLEIAVADGGLGGEREGADRGLRPTSPGRRRPSGQAS